MTSICGVLPGLENTFIHIPHLIVMAPFKDIAKTANIY